MNPTPKMPADLDKKVSTEKGNIPCTKGCEDRCAKAESDNCNCECAGRNHGSARQIKV